MPESVAPLLIWVDAQLPPVLSRWIEETKDEDFLQLQERRGAPPQLVWLTCGNLSNRQLKQLLLSRWKRTVELLRAGEPLVEINEGRSSD